MTGTLSRAAIWDFVGKLINEVGKLLDIRLGVH